MHEPEISPVGFMVTEVTDNILGVSLPLMVFYLAAGFETEESFGLFSLPLARDAAPVAGDIRHANAS